MSFFESQRSSEHFVRVSAPALYFFIHQLERANTKQFRRAECVEVGEFALCFKAKVLDPSLMRSSMDDEVFIEVRVSLEGAPTLDVRGRVVWTESVGDDEERNYLIGIEYTQTDEDKRDEFLAQAKQVGEAVDPARA